MRFGSMIKPVQVGAMAVLACAWILAGVACSRSSDHTAVVDQVTARKIVLVDGDGKPSIELATRNGASGMYIFGKDGQMCVQLSTSENLTVLRLAEGNTGGGIELGFNTDGNAFLAMNKQPNLRFKIAVNESEGNLYFIRDSKVEFIYPIEKKE